MAAVAVRSSPAPRVLVVEDEHEIYDLIADMLEDEGIEVQCAQWDREAYLALGVRHGFAALLMDINLGQGTTGFDVAHFARQIDSEVPVISFSGQASEASLQSVRGAQQLLPCEALHARRPSRAPALYSRGRLNYLGRRRVCEAFGLGRARIDATQVLWAVGRRSRRLGSPYLGGQMRPECRAQSRAPDPLLVSCSAAFTHSARPSVARPSPASAARAYEAPPPTGDRAGRRLHSMGASITDALP